MSGSADLKLKVLLGFWSFLGRRTGMGPRRRQHW
jgi:hypothetical protein